MASRPYREADSPSASSTFLPQLRRGSRRGSLSSLSSNIPPDRETLSQALDLIHSSASQSGSLTTFNEYTSPPSSSSGPDSKSITGELQGGITGFYHRIRASVGGVKDAIIVGGEDAGSSKASVDNTAFSPSASTTSVRAGGHHARSSDPQVRQSTPTQHSSSTQHQDDLSPTSIPRAGLKPPPAQVSAPTRTTFGADPPGKQVGIQEHDTAKTLSQQTTDHGIPLDHEHEAVGPQGRTPATTRESGEKESQQLTEPAALNPTPLSQLDNARVQNPVASRALPGATKSLTPAAQAHGAIADDLFVSSTLPQEPEAKAKTNNGKRYQHLEIPLRKSLAPPIISRSTSPRPDATRASSSETNVDSLQSVPLHASTPYSKTGLDSDDESAVMNISPEPRPVPVRDPRTMNVFTQVKNKVLNKEYWMKDENARDCFYCGDAFSTFRRKHHCRTCGQIFDAKCTSVIPGGHFGQQWTLRVCKPCEGIIKGDDDSSEFSDDGSFAMPGFRPRHGSTGASDTLASPNLASSPTLTDSPVRNAGNPDLTAPTMSIPATRKAGEKASRKPAVLEIGTERGLARPSSSRSLKSAFGSRSHGPGHRRHNSRNQFARSFNPVNEDNAPFHQDALYKKPPERLATFHDDNIIDPDLAPYLSDEQSSGDEQVSIMAALNGSAAPGTPDDRHGWEAGAAQSKKPRSRFGDKSMSSIAYANRDSDSHSLSSMRPPNSARPSKRRNFSISSGTHLRPSPRSYRANATALGSSSSLRESTYGTAYTQIASPLHRGGSRLIRSSSMRGASAPPLELNKASLQHVQRLLSQLLSNSAIPGQTNWERALLPILLRATDDVNPDVQNGDDIDIRHYVKLKKIAGGKPGDTAYVSGLVFTKNLALKCMPRSISHPNILILTFPLEYSRHQQHFMSLEPVIRQEREFLQNLVNRIAALRPHLLLVERHVSGLALEFLTQANIATAYNVKLSVLEAVARCCQTRIITSIDKLAIKPAQAGKCASFYLKTYVNGRRKKTYMFLSGCAKELGCTIVLRGADTSTLRKIKRVTEFMIYVVYNLKLETCLMRDESALLPCDVDIGSLAQGTNDPNHYVDAEIRTPDQPKASEDLLPSHTEAVGGASNSQTVGETRNARQAGESATKPGLPEEDSLPDDVPMPQFYGDMVEEHRTKILSASPFVKFMQPYLLMRAREQERRLAYLKRLRDEDVRETQEVDKLQGAEKFDLIQPEMVHKRMPNASKKVREVLYAVHDSEYDKALHIYQTQSRQWESYISGNIDLFDPFAHQHITILYSIVCTTTTVPCSGPDIVALGFYNEHETDADFEADCTLGQYIEDLCLGAHTVCSSHSCEKKMMDHHRQYVQGEAQLSVFVEPCPSKMRDMQDSIFLWSVCRKCGSETDVTLMSENTWKYSFGKYLELSFWSSPLRTQLGNCTHDLHRDHLRYFGFKDIAVRIHYDPIALLEIIVPRARITWKVDNDLRFRNEVFTKIEARVTKFMHSVRNRVRSITAESVLPEKIESCQKEIERLVKQAADDQNLLIQRMRDIYMSSKHWEIIPLNQIIRALQHKVVEWDNTFADFDKNFFPSEKDIRRLATLQLKKIFLDRDDSSASLTSDGSAASPEILNEKSNQDDVPSLVPQTRRMSPDKAHDLLASVVERNSSTAEGLADDAQDGAIAHSRTVSTDSIEHTQEAIGRQEIQHLDLAVPSEILEQTDTKDSSRSRTPETSLSLSRPVSREDKIKTPKIERLDTISSDGEDHPPEPSASEQTVLAKPNPNQNSGIPRPVESKRGGIERTRPTPSMSRAYSQPAIPRYSPQFNGSPLTEKPGASVDQNAAGDSLGEPTAAAQPATSKPTDRKISDRLGLSALKPSGLHAHSMIPRSIANRRSNSRVSHLAKHFEQLSREFEKERIKERRQWAAQHRQPHAHPMRASKPIVEIYRNVHEAVEEKEPSDEDLLSSDPSSVEQETSQPDPHPSTSTAMAENQITETPGEGFHGEETTAENTETEDTTADESRTPSDVEGEGIRSDDEPYPPEEIKVPGNAEEHHALSPEEAQLDMKLDLPKHEKSSLMKMLTNFWAERSASGWESLDYPLRATEHIFADSDIIVREDEPSSLIAFALGSEDYQLKLAGISDSSSPPNEAIDDDKYQDPSLSPAEQIQIEKSLLRPTGTHLKYQFSNSSAKMLCKVFYAEQFDAVRRKCGVSTRMVESLSRCMKWDSKGGKTKSVFLKTLDDRFVLKSLSPIETQAFLRFAPAYFRIMSESLFHELPSVIAKMLGFYQVIIKNPATGVEFNWFLLVMENLFYDRAPTRIFDLKGSMRNRRIQSTGEQNEVLLDENMVEFIYESPLFTREHSKKLLRASVWNDTLFLSRQNVMDYSLMIAIDENRKELVVGIIDCIRTYTWDKKLESWIKDRGKNRPTVTSPKEYKSRFREAMGRYVLQAPNCWHQFKAKQVETAPLQQEDPGEDKDAQVLGAG